MLLNSDSSDVKKNALITKLWSYYDSIFLFFSNFIKTCTILADVLHLWHFNKWKMLKKQ